MEPLFFRSQPLAYLSFLAISGEKQRSALFLHKQLHHNLCGVSYARAGTEDGGNTGFVEEVVVLRGDDTTGGDHDVGTAEFLEFGNHLRNQGLVTCRQ